MKVGGLGQQGTQPRKGHVKGKPAQENPPGDARNHRLHRTAWSGARRVRRDVRDQTRVALFRIADGTWIDADLTLIRSQPELAPSSMTPGPATNGDTPAPSSPPTVGVWMMSILREVPLLGEGGLHQTAMPVAL